MLLLKHKHVDMLRNKLKYHDMKYESVNFDVIWLERDIREYAKFTRLRLNDVKLCKWSWKVLFVRSSIGSTIIVPILNKNEIPIIEI